MSEQTTEPTGQTAVRATASGRHPVNIGHLVMGVAFAGLVAVWALVASGAVGGGDVRWLLPVPWVLAGLAGLVGLVTADRRAARAMAALDPDPGADGTLEP